MQDFASWIYTLLVLLVLAIMLFFGALSSVQMYRKFLFSATKSRCLCTQPSSACKMSYLQTNVISHASRVRKLYKDAARLLLSIHGNHRHIFRYHAVILRARFDENKDEVDMRVAKKLVQDGEQELFLKQHPQPLKFANSPGGVAYSREPHEPDWLFDTWHPLEKAQYPEYFARREIRKREFIERWEKKYGSAGTSADH